MADFQLKIKELVKEFDKQYESKIEKWNTEKDILGALVNDVTKKWELKIEEAKKEKYVTDTVENAFKDFTKQCMDIIVENFDMLSKYNEEILKELFSHRHFGHGFYESYEFLPSIKNEIKKMYEQILSDDKYEKILYMSLVKYFLEFYGKFSDNEEAIRKIPQYFPPNDEEGKNDEFNEEEKDNIARALYLHIGTAGTPGDFGFAYGGISLIKEYINKLPEDIVLKVLGKYTFNQIINDKVYRNQLYTIIDNMNTKGNRKEYKFFFIDSVLILNVFQDVIKRKNKVGWKGFDWRSKSNMECRIKNEGGYELAYNKFSSRRIGSQDGEVLNIEFTQSTEAFINIQYKQEPIYQMAFAYYDWIMNEYESDEFYEQVEKAINSQESSENPEELENKQSEIEERSQNNKYIYSYVYLNNYRGIKHQSLSFDKRYVYDYNNKKIQFNDDDTNDISKSHFYGKNVLSLSCIVGKNGTGKTSIIDFLKDQIFKLIHILNTSIEESDKDNHEKVIRELLKRAGLNEDIEVLVLFTVDETSYLITNIDSVTDCTNSITKPKEHFIDKSKMIYFSSKIDLNYWDEDRKSNEEDSEIKTLLNYGKADYSAVKSLAMKLNFSTEKRENLVYNKDFCYQLYFLKHHENYELEDYLWKDFKKGDLKISKGEYEKIFLKAITNEPMSVLSLEEENQFMKMISQNDIKITHFSSGQFAKFLFLSKLFWCLVGFKKYSKDIEKIISESIFHAKEMIDENESAIIFIDEGELYYHPEWQRTYINTLIKMINKDEVNAFIQIILTTNSPFILSDIRSEDVSYLPHKGSQQLTFGQNIHTLLRQNFFMESTIGEFSRSIMEFIMTELSTLKDSEVKDRDLEYISDQVKKRFKATTNKDTVYDYLKTIINGIGEEVYRNKLLGMLEQSFRKNNLLDELKEKKAQLEKEIKKLEEGSDSNDSHGTL